MGIDGGDDALTTKITDMEKQIKQKTNKLEGRDANEGLEGDGLEGLVNILKKQHELFFFLRKSFFS